MFKRVVSLTPENTALCLNECAGDTQTLTRHAPALGKRTTSSAVESVRPYMGMCFSGSHTCTRKAPLHTSFFVTAQCGGSTWAMGGGMLRNK